MKTAIANQVQVELDAGITKAGTGVDEVVWSILGHTYYLKAEGANAFAFETYDPPGTYVPPHIHPTQDEFIYVLENGFDLYLDGQHHKANAGDQVRMPAGIPHGYYNLSDKPTRALFWVAPGRRLRELFDALHNLADPMEVVKESAKREVHFLKPEDYVFDPLKLKGGGVSAIDPRLEAEYNNRAKVPDHPAVMAGWKERARALRDEHGHAELDLAYGAHPRNVLDVFWPDATTLAPLAVFFHGGYWQALDKSWFSHLAHGFNARGIALAVPSYRLCPEVALATIVDDMRDALAFLMRRYARDVIVTGHSAGGQLTAMALATDWRALGASQRLKGGVAISGLFDLRPLVHTSINTALALDEAEAQRLSPITLPKPAVPLVAYVGAREGAEYERQSAAIAALWDGRVEPIANADHFTAIAPLEDAGSAMMETIASMI